jgi:hypothetical protein
MQPHGQSYQSRPLPEVSPALFHSPCVKSRLIHETAIRLYSSDSSWIVHLLFALDMLKLIITECGGSPTEWEWRVCDAAGQPLRIGWQRSRNAAKQEGERTLFELIASDSINSIAKNMPTRGH